MAERRFWVFIEQEEGKPSPVSWELLGVAHKLASELSDELETSGDKVVVEGVLLGENVSSIAEAAIHYGADRVFCMDDPRLNHFRNRPYYKGIITLVEKYKPEVFLIGATTLGRDLAGAVATSLGTGLTADCTQLGMGVTRSSTKKLLLATRPAFGGNVMATIVCAKTLPQMASVRPRVFPMPAPDVDRKGEIIQEKLPEDPKMDEVEVLEIIREDVQAVNIEYADVIVSGGRGLGVQEGFELLKKLAAEFGGVVGSTRPCVDAGWINYPHQVGQSGKTVRPKLYIAAGISGALQHKVGISNSDFILAINKDPQAPIFEVSHIGITGDLYEVIPEIIKQITEMKEAWA
ncbi:MAG: electron transfer flavoprotein subunit alpha/FixB family protein [Anaerolineaceae bacterium]|nr:electron transfer flavoprotein subunit alpha/FixB family protein [Anaerolineaceae bacterium]